MDSRHFDALTKALTGAGTRRGVLGLLAALPVLGGLFALLDLDEMDAKGRRRRRKKRHKHGKGRRRKHRKKTCKAHSKTKTCSGKCGQVKDNCKKTVDCGACACASNAACGAGSLCREDGFCQACDVTCPGGTCPNAALLTALDGGGTVYVCPGRYIGNLPLTANVTVIGAGQSGDEHVGTIFDADGGNRVVHIEDGLAVTLRRLHITGGSGSFGGGVLNEGNLTLVDCTIFDNGAISTGGGVQSELAASLTMTGCTVRDNSSHGDGGGIYINGPAILTNCSIGPDNSAGNNGGGIFNNGTTLTLNGGSVTGNSADKAGDDIFNTGTLIDNGASIVECVDSGAGCGCPGNVCP